MWTESQIQKAAANYEALYGGVKMDAFIAGAHYILNNMQENVLVNDIKD